MRLLAAIVAIILFFIGALLAFGWFGVAANLPKAVGFDSLGLIALTVALAVGDAWPVVRRNPPA
jgi:hypothetical protein